jgi:hypothetical protein
MVLSLSNEGQNKGVASVDISVSVIKALQINNLQGDLSFGDFIHTGVATKIKRSPDNGIQFEVKGTPGRDITFDFNNIALRNESETKLLSFVPHLSQTKSSSSYVNPTEVVKGSSHKLENNNGTGSLYLWVGGEILVDKELSDGDYSGEFSITVSY